MKSNTIALYRKISQDQVLSAKLSSISDQDELAIEVIRLGEQFALPVILEDVREYLEPRQNSELNDDELEMVVGGKGGKSASADRKSVV